MRLQPLPENVGTERRSVLLWFPGNYRYPINYLLSARDDVVIRRRGYSDHVVMMCVCVCVRVWMGVCVSTIKRKPLIRMT